MRNVTQLTSNVTYQTQHHRHVQPATRKYQLPQAGQKTGCWNLPLVHEAGKFQILGYEIPLA